MVKMTAANNTVVTCINSVFYVSRNDDICEIRLSPDNEYWIVRHGETVVESVKSLEAAMNAINRRFDQKAMKKKGVR